MPQQTDTIQTIKDIAHNIGFGAAPVALTTGNHLANAITVVSAIALLLPKLADMFMMFLNIFKKQPSQTLTNPTDATIN